MGPLFNRHLKYWLFEAPKKTTTQQLALDRMLESEGLIKEKKVTEFGEFIGRSLAEWKEIKGD